MQKGLVETVPPMYVGFAFQVEEIIVPYYSWEVSQLVAFLYEM